MWQRYKNELKIIRILLKILKICQVHSNKNPVYATHFSDEYNENPRLGPDVFNVDEEDLPLFYEVLDHEIDAEVLNLSLIHI